MDMAHNDDSLFSIDVMSANEDFMISATDTFGIKSMAKKYKQESLKTKVLPDLNTKELLFLNLYKRMGMTTAQKRDFHALLVRLSSVADFVNLTKYIFYDVKDTVCCSDKTCLCDPTHQFRISTKDAYQNDVPKRTFGYDVDDFQLDKLAELKDTQMELVRLNRRLSKLRGTIKHEDEDLNNFVNLLLLRKDVAYNKEMLYYLKEKLRNYL